ncbi:MAG: hypothetical protein WC378_06220 [Opitutaceae bacterium]|jgi:hypothetical protein
MKWVILAIALFIIGYTVVMVFYRKPGKAYRPYQDSTDRATVARLLSSGYQRASLIVDRPADPSRELAIPLGGMARTKSAPGGFPGNLDAAMIEKPLLADSYSNVAAPSSAQGAQPYRILLTANLPDNKRMIAGAVLFRRGKELSVVPVFERISGSLQARWRETSVLVTVPADTLPAGKYELTLIGGKSSQSWLLDLRQ